MSKHLFLAFVVTLVAGSAFADQPTAAKSQPCSLLIRVPRATVEPKNQEVLHEDKVDMVVLGTRALGNSTTRGVMHVALDERRREPSLSITFAGTSHSRTVGSNGPAILHSRSSTTFQCSRRIEFNLNQGFVARPSVVQSNTNLTVDAIGSSQPGLRGRLVRRIAWRRAGDSHGQATAIVARETEKDLRRGFEQAVDAYLADLNAQMREVRQLALAMDADARLCLTLAGPERDTVVLYLADNPEGPVALPELTATCSGAELWMRSPAAGRSLTLPGSLSVLSQHFTPLGGVLAVAPLMDFSKLQSSLGYRSEGDWLVFGLGDTPPPSADLTNRLVVKKPVVGE